MPAASWPLRDPCAALLLAPPRHKTVTSPSNSLSIQTEKRDPANQPLERCNECHCYRPTRSRSHTLSAIIEFLHDCLSSTLLQLFIFFSLAFHRRFFPIFSLPPLPPSSRVFPLNSLLFLLFLSFVSSRCWFRWLLKLWKRLDASALARLNGDESTIRGDASSGMPPVFYDSQVPYKFT